MAKIVNIHEAKTHLSRLVEEVRSGKEIILAKGGKPCAKLVPFREPSKRPLGFVAGRVTEAFFEPLPEEELTTWQ
ncbi:MAG: type II toxin-antitoxin system Phd/YefM family antitoxin [Armatimonadetes bacterium]|nr:type II toxin-antitoxin system Phd/YefM family antitoxin [Armatimonadota bacterium]